MPNWLQKRPERREPHIEKTVRTPYVDVYTETIDSALASLDAVTEPEDAHPFVLRTATQLRSASANISEFYIGEFFNIFKDMVIERVRDESAECQQALRDAKAEAATVSAELQTRLTTAHAAGDREAEHVVWREREIRQTACQGKVDAASKRVDMLSLRLSVFQELASTLGIDFT